MSSAPQSPQTTGAAPATQATPSQKDIMLMFHIMENMKTKPDVDWGKVATNAGYKSAGVAKVRYGQIKRKLFDSGKTGNDNVGSPTKAKATRVTKAKAPVKRRGPKKVSQKMQETRDAQIKTEFVATTSNGGDIDMGDDDAEDEDEDEEEDDFFNATHKHEQSSD